MSIQSRSRREKRFVGRSKQVATSNRKSPRVEELERRELLTSLICDGPEGTWQGEPGSPFVRWCSDLEFSSPSSLAAADFNNDGVTDLAVGTNDPTENLSVLISRGDGPFASMRRTGEGATRFRSPRTILIVTG